MIAVGAEAELAAGVAPPRVDEPVGGEPEAEVAAGRDVDEDLPASFVSVFNAVGTETSSSVLMPSRP